MKPKDYARLRELFAGLWEAAPQARGEQLEQLRAAERSMAERLERLLARAEETTECLRAPSEDLSALDANDARDGASPSSGVANIPHQVDQFRVRRLIGAGGMGVVYEAEHIESRRVVALKFIHPAQITPPLLRRFELETQLLARLEHPGIARIYDVGSIQTISGPQPYFVMERVHGLPLPGYADLNHLDTPARIRLFSRLCEAVQHAHHRGVIHRDLKPSNVLVDEEGQPKILDFGVARALDGEGPGPPAAALTGAGQWVGTVWYMSPEQFGGHHAGVDVRSDLYSLGVMLFELLTGRLPFDFGNKPLIETIEIIRHAEPRRLGSVDPSLRGDLDAIVCKCLEKEKLGRYQSAAELAADLDRHLHDLPVHARRAGTVYRLRKFARRHRLAIASWAAVATVSSAAAGLIAWQADEAGCAREQAVEAARGVDLLCEFISNTLASAGPDAAMNPQLTLRETLDDVADRVTLDLAGYPILEARVRHTLGATYQSLGLFDKSQAQLEQAVALMRSELDTAHPDLARSLRCLGWTLCHKRMFAKAEPVFQEAMDLVRAGSGEQTPEFAECLCGMGNVLVRDCRRTEALPILERSLQMRRTLLGPRHPDVAQSLRALGAYHLVIMDLAESEKAYESAIAILKEAGDRPMELAILTTEYSSITSMQGKVGQTEALIADALRLNEQIFDATHPEHYRANQIKVDILGWQQRHVEAEDLCRRTIRMLEERFGPDHYSIVFMLVQLGEILCRSDHFDEAEATYRRALELSRTQVQEFDEWMIGVEFRLGAVYWSRGQFAPAESMFRQVIDAATDCGDGRHIYLHLAVNSLGVCLRDQGKFDEAELMLRRALDLRRRLYGDEHSFVSNVIINLAKLHELRGSHDAALTFCERGLSLRLRALGDDHVDVAEALTLRGRLLTMEGRLDEAQADLSRAVEVFGSKLGQENSCTADAGVALGVCLARLGRLEEATPLLRNGYSSLQRVRGEKHPWTIRASRQLALLGLSL
jgi:eukaryotic-like serine/threonine-protein kinase